MGLLNKHHMTLEVFVLSEMRLPIEMIARWNKPMHGLNRFRLKIDMLFVEYKLVDYIYYYLAGSHAYR